MKKDTLYLPLKAQWYNMYECGEKKEEYREITPHWIQRLVVLADGHSITKADAEKLAQDIELLKTFLISGRLRFKYFSLITFSYGYTKRTLSYQSQGICIGRGLHPEWGAPDKEVFILPIGLRVYLLNQSDIEY